MKKSFTLRAGISVFSVLLLFNVARSSNITVSGTISSNTTWSADTIFISGNVTVNNGVTLTINAGKYIIFKGHYGLYIQGRLLSQGTPTSRITFTATNTSTGWSGIRFSATPTTNDTSFITYCKILYGNANTGTAEDQMGGGIFVKSFSKLVVCNCMISNCYASRYGGAITLTTDASPVIINNILCNNTAVSLGGAICIQRNSNAQIINNTIANNHSNAYSGGIDITSSTPTIKNCIIWGNTATYNPQIYPNNYSNVSYSDIDGGWTGTGNINSDPKFISPTTGSGIGYSGFSADWGLGSTTSCLNRGSLSLPVYLPPIDVAGNLRVDYDTIEIGALEYIQSETLCGAISSSKTTSKFVIVTCDVTVNNGVTLTIPAGTKVRFLGPYKLNIQGKLLAEGTFDKLIRFCPASTSNPWKGIRFDATPNTNDTSKIEYCIIQYSYAIGSGNDNYGGAVFVNNVNKLIIRNNYLTNNRAYSSGGAIYINNASPYIVGNLIANNTTDNPYGGGIYLASGNPYIICNTITRNSSPSVWGNGIFVNSGASVMRNNIVWRNTYTGGSASYQLYGGTNVQYCNIEGGIYSGTGNISTDPLFKSVTAGSGSGYNGLSADWALQSTSTLINAGTPGTFSALNAANFNLKSLDPNGKTRVYGTIDIGAFEDVSSINVCGNITQNTTWNANTVHVTCDVTVANGVTLTIAAGTKVVFDNYYVLRVTGRLLAVGTRTDTIRFYALNPSANKWAGIRFDNQPSPSSNYNDTSKFLYCIIEHGYRNGPYERGAGMFISDYDKVLISDCVFRNNFVDNWGAAGGLFVEGSTILIKNSKFINNTAYFAGGLRLKANQFTGRPNNSIVENCYIANNLAYYNGGGMDFEYNFTGKIINTSIVNNTCNDHGGGVLADAYSPASFINCTISNNNAPNAQGGGFFLNGNADITLKNCIVYGNRAINAANGNQFYIYNTATDPKIYFSDIEGGTAAFSGVGSGANYANIYYDNIDQNPLFISPSAGAGNSFNGMTANWGLQQGSPCINTGSPDITGLDLPSVDLEGNPRIYNGHIDMGSFENQQPIYKCGTISSDEIWNVDTINVNCDIVINSGVTLAISPGTYVQFTGPYKIEVKGRLLAEGTANRMITFCVKDTNYFSRIDSFNRGCWKGIYFNSIATTNDSSKLIFCKLLYGKAAGPLYSQDGRGGAVYISNSNKVLISNCIISNNKASFVGSALCIETSNPRLLNNLICNNSVNVQINCNANGGTIYLYDASPEIFNNIIVNNSTANSCGGILASQSYPVLKNCIIWGNTTLGASLYFSASGSADIYNSDIQGGYANIIGQQFINNYQSNINADPQFNTPSAGAGTDYKGMLADWSLKSNSPCLNTGTPSIAGMSMPNLDFLGNQRIIGDTIDMGAIEIQINRRFITSQPTPLTACVGSKITFSVSTSIAVAYQWQKDGVDITGARSKILNINAVSTSDSGYYRCIMSNQNGNIISDSAKLTVRTLPAINTHPTPASSACQGGIASFNVVATGSSPLTYQWYDLNGAVAGGGNPTYMINPVLSTSASTYRCVVTNNCGTAISNGATLTINTPVSVSPITTSNSICVGNTVSLSTIGTGTAPITYQWCKNATPISGATTFTYQITNAQTSAAGNYYCKATNVCGSDSTNTSSLVVNTTPSITYQSPADSVCTGQNKTFVISASSSLPITYQWYYNSTTSAITGATNNIYTINSVASTNGGSYYCKASNTCGTEITTPIYFTVKSPPSITTQSSSQVLCVGQQANFSVTATGTAPITYKWYKDNTFITGAVNSTYQIATVTTSDAGNYYCVITNSCGSINSSVKTLTVNSAPSIASQSASDSVCLGASKSFSITATGSSPITYQWYYNTTSNAITGATNNFYTINSVATSHGGLYYCKASNSCGNVTTSQITLFVKTAPYITTQSSNLVLCATQQANFSVTATGTAPITYKWYKDNTLISGATNNTYQISSVSTSDAGNYYCVITNSCGSINSSVKTLTVNTTPSVSSQSASDSVCLGASKSFSITATGSSPITCQWYYNTTSNAITGATNNFYTINSVATSHGGLYYCKATNSCGDATTSQIGLTIKTPASITSQSSNLVLCATQQANFSVTATGTAPITYKWYKDNTLISGAVSSTYQINSVTTSDDGNYYCVISNSCGSVNSSVKMLTVNTVPVITYQSASDSVCQGQNVSLNIIVSGSAPISYQWYYNTTSNAIAGATGNIYAINSIGLLKGGLYYCKATNTCGSATTSQINLIVKTAPVISAQSSGATRCIGQGQNFSVTASGSPAPRYQWFKDNVALSGATNNTYAISVIAISDAGNYYCIVSNSCASVQSTVQSLAVNTPPDITSQSSNTTKCSGQSITLDVTSSGTVPIAYQWYHLGNPINGAVNNFYSLYNIDPADSGSYYCIATNACGTDQSANISLKVNLPVSVYKQSRDTSKCVGDATLFNVQIRGTMPVYYSWYFEQDSITGAHSNILFMDSLTQANSGNYFCEMTNVCGTVQGAYKELTVRALPVVNLGNDTTFCLGGSIDLSADGPYYCKWNNGSTKSWLNVTHSGTFFVHVTDPYGCKNYSNTIIVTVIEPYPNQILCVVTVDPGSGKNLIAWERVRGYKIASYNIYKETSQTGVYLKIGSLPFDSLSVFIDYASEPRKKADRYAITVVDSCGNESDYSPFHKTIHLTASKGASGTENNLNWNHYEGFNFNTYKIYRGTSPSNMVLIDSIASNLNSFTDMKAPNGIAFYQVSAVKPDTCYPAITRAQTNSGPYSQSVSNLKDYTQIPTGYISAAPTDAYVGWKDGSTAFFNIYTNLSAWDANTGSNWFNIIKDFQNNILQAVVFQNYSAQPRSDTIRITAAGLPDQTVVVHQEGTTAIAETLPDINLLVYPNPFNYSTNIDYELHNEADVNIEVYNLLGSKVASVVNKHQLPGKYNYLFNEAPTDGIYILRIVVNNNTYIKKLIKTE